MGNSAVIVGSSSESIEETDDANRGLIVYRTNKA
jgi:hypothetical protein